MTPVYPVALAVRRYHAVPEFLLFRPVLFLQNFLSGPLALEVQVDQLNQCFPSLLVFLLLLSSLQLQEFPDILCFLEIQIRQVFQVFLVVQLVQLPLFPRLDHRDRHFLADQVNLEVLVVPADPLPLFLRALLSVLDSLEVPLDLGFLEGLWVQGDPRL